MNWFEIAKGELGVQEIVGGEDNPRIIEYAACTSLHASDDETPWCSAFVNWCMKQAGIKGTGLANARSWLDWGTPIPDPVEGCVVILKRGTPPSGHVCFFVSYMGNGWIKCLGGNQGDPGQVKYSNFKMADVLGYRMPT